MFIYLEGPDGTGKTTLARELCRQQNAVYLHDTYRGRHQFMYTVSLLRRAHKHLTRGRAVVLDRSWLGDNIYSRVFRPGKQGSWVRWAHGLTERLGAVTVMALPIERSRYLEDYERLQGERPEMYSSMAGIYDAYMAVTVGREVEATDYAGLLSRTGGLMSSPNTMLYDRFSEQGSNLEKTASKIWEMARRRDAREMTELPNFQIPNWSGRQVADCTLIVGERSNRPDGAWPVPFLADDASSRYLALALNRAGIRQDKLVMVNAREDNDRPSWALRTALHREPRRVVALGKVALQTVRELNPFLNNVEHVEHPQYWRRFKYHDLATYASKLKEACA